MLLGAARLVPGADRERANALHHVAHEKCFIANSVNFPVAYEPKIIVS
jgi:organic hydroperoxide reductase OsmC/OhrA